MTLTLEKQGQIALAILKSKLRKEKRLPDLNEFKRNLGNQVKELGFPKEELVEFMLVLLKEITNEVVSGLEEIKINKTGGTH